MTESSAVRASFSSLSLKNKSVVILIFLILFSLGLGAGILVFGSKRTAVETTPAAPGASSEKPPLENVVKPEAVLRFEPSVKKLRSGQTIKVSLLLDKAAGQAVRAVFEYDQDYLSVSALKSGRDYPLYPLLKTDGGTATVSASLSPEKNLLPQLPSVLASFSLTAKKATGGAEIRFNQSASVVAKNGKNILRSVENAAIVIE